MSKYFSSQLDSTNFELVITNALDLFEIFRTPSIGSHEQDECVNCAHLNEELQRARMVIRKLVKQVNELKSLIQENNDDKGETLSETDVNEHLCENELMQMEAIKLAVLDVDMNDDRSEFSLTNQTQILNTKSEHEQPDFSRSAIELNESNSIASTSVSQNQLSNHKCNCLLYLQFCILFKKW